MPKLIPVNTGNFAIVDDEDFEELSKRNWFNYGSCGLYAAAKINGKSVMMHRIIMGVEKPFVVDHINNNSFDNRRSNLRIFLGKENHINVRKSLAAKNDRRLLERQAMSTTLRPYRSLKPKHLQPLQARRVYGAKLRG